MTWCWIAVGRLATFSGTVPSHNPVTTRNVGDIDWIMSGE